MQTSRTSNQMCSIVFLVLAAGLCIVAPARAVQRQVSTAANRADRVAYTSFLPGNWDVYLFQERGQQPERLTTHFGLDYDPVISPDGRWLVFCSERRGNPDLYIVDLKNRSEPRLLINSDSMEDQAAFSADGTKIAFVSTFSGNAEIYLLPFRPEKTVLMSAAENITRHPGGDFRPKFSPDGRKLAFSSDRDHSVNPIASNIRVRGGDIYLMDLSSKRTQRLTNVSGWAGSPSWSSDGQMITYYVAEPRTGGAGDRTRGQIWLMQADGTNQRRVTTTETTALSPEFTLDDRILYSRRTAENSWQIVSRKIDGSDERIESDASQNYWGPRRASSSGTFVAYGTGPKSSGVPDGVTAINIGAGPFLVAGAPFTRKLPDRSIDLYPVREITAFLNPAKDQLVVSQQRLGPGTDALLSRIDGTEQHAFLPSGATLNPGTAMAWSHDGQWIAFTDGDSGGTGNGQGDIWKVRADGTELQNLTRNPERNNTHPTFSGDGKQIVFRAGPPGNHDLYLMNADGTNVRRLTNERADHLFPVFSPAARQVAFVSDRDNRGSSVYEIYLLDFNDDGTQKQLRRITHNDVQEGHLAFSYDGKWLIFSSEQGGINDEEPLSQSFMFSIQPYGEMYAYRLRNGMTVRLTHNKWEEGVPSWEAPLPR